MTTVEAQPVAGGAAFQRWQRTRPFWGGLFLLLSAGELFLSSNMDLTSMKVHLGPTGFLSYVIPLMLALCGALVWASPGQRMFYGIVGLAVAVYSLIGLNLGGFVLGMVLGVVGGALSVAWAPVVPRTAPGAVTPKTEQDDDPDSADVDAAPTAEGRRHRRLNRPNTFPRLWIVLVVLATPVAAQFRVDAASAAPTPVEPDARVLAADPGQPWVNQAPSRMLAANLTMTGLSYDGVVDLPTATGTIRALLFSMKSSVATPFELRAPTTGGGQTSIRSRSLTVEGSVKFYTTRFHANLLGFIPVTYTPASPPFLTVPDILFTNADIDLVYVTSDKLAAPAMTINPAA